MQKLFYATGNASKIYNMRLRLAGLDIELLTPGDLGVHIDVDEDGLTPAANALKKASAYYARVQLPTIAGDSALYIDGLPDAQQPGLYVRRVHGKTLTDEEMIDYYAGLAAQQGGSCRARYATGLAMATAAGTFTCTPEDEAFLLTAQRDSRPHRGNPLDALSIDPATGKYYTQLSDAELNALGAPFNRACVAFITKVLAL